MSNAHDPKQPSLTDLMGRYLERSAEAQAAGLAPAAQGEVVPFEAAPVQAVDPRVAWDEAQAALRHFGAKAEGKAPPDWPALVADQEPTAALAFAVGNFPQLVRHLQPLLTGNPAKMRPTAGRPVPAAALVAWAEETVKKHEYPQALLALGALRLAHHFDVAEKLMKKHAKDVPAEHRAAWANEEAALAWHRGKAEDALKLWKSQADSLPVLFNRGMAALFLGQKEEARASLTAAISQLPESSAWHHLGRLYLALAEMK